MAVIVELIGRPGEYLVTSNAGHPVGYIKGSDTHWRWSIYGAPEVQETSFTRARAAVLREIANLAPKTSTSRIAHRAGQC